MILKVIDCAFFDIDPGEGVTLSLMNPISYDMLFIIILYYLENLINSAYNLNLIIP